MRVIALARTTVVWRYVLARVPPGGWFAFAFFALLAMPALLQLVHHGPVDLGAENRRPAPPPSWPGTVTEIPRLPAIVDAYLADRFGLRGPLVRLNTFLRWHALGEIASSQLIAGRNGRVFLGAFDGAPPNSLIVAVCGASASDEMAAQAAASIRNAIQIARTAGLDPTLLLVPTAARLNSEDLPPALAAKCAGHTPLGDAIAARVTDLPVVYPVAEMMRLGGIPRHRFHWAGEVPRHVAETLAETRWGLPRSFVLPFTRKSRSSDLNRMSPGLGLSDMIEEPQLRAAGAWDCWFGACIGAGPPAEAVPLLTGYARPGKGRLLIVGDSFSDDIAPNFIQEFAEVWVVHTYVSRAMTPSAHAALSAWLHQHFRNGRVLLVVHDWGASGNFGQLVSGILASD
jgi:hypothetical protein